MAFKDIKIKELLGTGLSPKIVSQAVGCDPSYISQLLSNEDFLNQVIELKSKHAVAHTQRDLTWDSAEDKLLVKLHDMIDEERFSKPEQLMMAIRTVNGAQRRGVKVIPQHSSAASVVPLQLPKVVKNIFTINQKGEVIDVGGQTLVTMPSSQLVKQISDQRGEDDEGAFSKLGKAIQRVG